MEFLALLGFFASYFALYIYVRKRRTKKLKEVADKLFLEFTAESDSLHKKIVSMFKGHDLLQRGTMPSVKNIFQGKHGFQHFYSFEYSYNIRIGRRSSECSFSVFAIDDQNLNIPFFNLFPETFLSKVTHMDFSGQLDIDFENNEEFSRAFILKGADEEKIRSTFNERHFSYFLRNTQFCASGGQGSLMLYSNLKPVASKNYEQFIQSGKELYDLFSY